MDISDNGLNLLKQWEDWSPTMYLDSGGKPTIGWGHLILPDEPELLITTIDHVKGEELLRNDLSDAVKAVNIGVIATINQNQYDSLTSFCFNVGVGSKVFGKGFLGSTLLKKVNIDPSDPTIQQEFERWDLVNGQPSVGLKNRRIKEWTLYQTPATAI